MIKTEAYNDCQQFLALTKKNGVKAGKLYVKKPLNVASAFNVTRNLAAYRTNQEGLLELMGANVPRIDYANGCPELLVENEVTNLLLYSEDFTNANWTKNDVTITANNTNAPNNELTADLVTATGGTSFKYIYQNTALLNNGLFQSFYIKRNTAQFVQLLFSGIGEYVNFDLVNKTFSAYNGAIGYLEECYNGFLRIGIYSNNPLNTDGPFICFTSSLSAGRASAVSSSDSFWLWGAGLETTNSGRATSYIPTTTVAVTRPADIIGNSTFGYNNDTSTIFIRARLEFSESIQGLVTLGDGGVLDDYMSLWIVESGGDKFLAIDTYTNPDQNTIYVTLPNDGVYSIALGFNLLTAEYSLAVNGVIESTGTFVNTLPTSTPLTTMQLGRIGSNYDARVIGFMYFDSKLDDTSLENLTA